MKGGKKRREERRREEMERKEEKKVGEIGAIHACASCAHKRGTVKWKRRVRTWYACASMGYFTNDAYP